MNKHIQRTAWAAMLLLTAGCIGSSDSGGGSDMDDLARSVEQSQAAANNEPKPAETQPETQPEPKHAARKVDVEKTHQLKPDGSYMGAIMAANRSIRNKLDDIAWKKSVQLYQARNGHLPRNTEEFLNLVQSEGTPLPEIEEGHEFEYDPSEGQFGTLYEVTPAQQPRGR